MTKYSQKFGRLSGNGLTHAPEVEGMTDAEYLENGWKRLDLEAPEKAEGYWWKAGPFEEGEDGTIRPAWTEVPLKETPKTYSKLRIMLALTETGIWRSVREWLDSTVLAGTQTKLGELFDAAQVFRSDDPNFKPVLSDLKAKFGIPDSDAAGILEKCETT